MALTTSLKSIAITAMALILTDLSVGAPVTTTAAIGLHHSIADVSAETAVFTLSADINTSSQIATQYTLSAGSASLNHTYTLAQTTGDDLPSIIPLNCIKIAPLATLPSSNKPETTARAKRLVPRMTMGPTDGPMTTIEGVPTSVPFISEALIVTLPAPTTTSPSTSSSSIISLSTTTSTTTTSSSPAATNATTSANQSTEAFRPALMVAIIVPSVLAACWAFLIILYWRGQRVRYNIDISLEFEMVTTR